jgi:hypothetical protein
MYMYSSVYAQYTCMYIRVHMYIHIPYAASLWKTCHHKNKHSCMHAYTYTDGGHLTVYVIHRRGLVDVSELQPHVRKLCRNWSTCVVTEAKYARKTLEIRIYHSQTIRVFCYSLDCVWKCFCEKATKLCLSELFVRVKLSPAITVCMRLMHVVCMCAIVIRGIIACMQLACGIDLYVCVQSTYMYVCNRLVCMVQSTYMYVCNRLVCMCAIDLYVWCNRLTCMYAIDL